MTQQGNGGKPPGNGPAAQGNGPAAQGNGPAAPGNGAAAKVTPARLPAAGQGARQGGPPWMGAGMPVEKSMTFWPSAKRLMRRLSPYRARLISVLTLGTASVVLSVVVPKILGLAIPFKSERR